MKMRIRASERSELVTTSVRVQTRIRATTNPFAPSSLGSASDDIAAPMMQKLKSKYGGYSTFFKGFFIITCGPTILIYWAISFLNQLVRKLGMPLSKQLTEGDKKFALTITASRQKAFMLSWEWTSVLTMAVNIGIFVQVMSVLVTKFTYLGLAMLKDEISSWEIWQVTLMLISVGLFLFMLPPVPGVPIYFMAGTMLVGVCEDKMGLVGATIYATLLGIVLKVSERAERGGVLLN